MNKMVINHIEKLFVTNDAATIMREIEVQHPAAKLLIMASDMQEKEVGDGTNFVLIFGAQLLQNSAELLQMGLSPVEIIDGYNIAMKKTQEILPSNITILILNGTVILPYYKDTNFYYKGILLLNIVIYSRLKYFL